MDGQRAERIDARRALVLAVLAVGAAYALSLVTCGLLRIPYPFEIEWMEGGMLTHAARVREGLPIYARASADFVPFFYTPLYPIVVAWLSKIAGALTFGLARSVTFGATLATLGLVYLAVAREAGRMYGAIAVGLLAATYRFAGTFHDLVRPDALALALTFAGAYVARYAVRPRTIVLAAALFVAAFFTKQTSAVMAPAAAIMIFTRDRKLAALFVTVGALLGVACVAAYDRATDHWFWFYIFKGHQGHLFYWKNILLEYWRDVLFLAPGLLLVPALAIGYGKWTRWIAVALLVLLVVAFIHRVSELEYTPHMYYQELLYEKPHRNILVPPLVITALLAVYRLTETPSSRVSPYWLAMFAAGVLSSGLNHSTQWAYSNCFMPIALFGSVVVALAFKSLAADASLRGAALVAGAILVQLAAFAYDPRKQVPDARDRAAVALFEKRVAAIDGDVLIPAHPFVEYARARKIYLHQMGTGDVGFEGGVKDLWPRIARGEWRAVIKDSSCDLELGGFYYESDHFPYDDAQVLMSRTGFAVRPVSVWRVQNREEHELAPGVTGTFETGALAGWTPTGTAFGIAPTPRAKLFDLSGMQGDWAASSRGGAGAEGRLTSAPFVLTKPRVTLVTAGAPSTYVRVLVAGEEAQRLYPPRLPKMQAKSIDLRAHVGAQITIEIVDEGNVGAPANAGIVVDDLRTAD